MAKHTYIKKHPPTGPEPGERMAEVLSLGTAMIKAGADMKSVARADNRRAAKELAKL